jgi:pimeloyl-ACP methyl ester carboxylesterase
MFMRLMSIRGVGEVMLKKQRPTRESARRTLVELGHSKSLESGRIPESVLDFMAILGEHTRTRSEELRLVQRALGLRGMQPWARVREADLRAITVPTLFVAGEHDTHGGVPLARNAAALVPGSSLEIVPHAGHLLWLDDPSFVASAITRFVAG